MALSLNQHTFLNETPNFWECTCAGGPKIRLVAGVGRSALSDGLFCAPPRATSARVLLGSSEGIQPATGRYSPWRSLSHRRLARSGRRQWRPVDTNISVTRQYFEIEVESLLGIMPLSIAAWYEGTITHGKTVDLFADLSDVRLSRITP